MQCKWCKDECNEQNKSHDETQSSWKSSGVSVSGRDNTPPLQEDLVPRSRMAPERKAEKEEVKQIASLTIEWNQRTLRGRKAWRNDTTEVNKI